jgi:hypothetical protein
MAAGAGAVLLAALLLLPARAAPQQAASPAQAVTRAFYAYHMAHNAAFTPAAVRRRARWLSPALLEDCRAYFAVPRPADEVPPIDGDPFTDSQDYPATYRVGPATTAGDTARVSVSFTWTGGDRRAVSVDLVRAGGAWRIDDVRPSEGPSLRELLASKP